MDKKMIIFFLRLMAFTVYLVGCGNPDNNLVNSRLSQKPENQSYSEPQNIQVSLSLANSSVVLFEPVILNFTIQNNSNQNIKLDLGPNFKQGFIFTIVYPDGKIVQLPQLTKDELARPGNVSVEPQQTYSQKILLNEWVNFDSPGNYEIKGRFANPIKTEDGKVIVHLDFNTTVNVQPENAKRLKKVCADLAQSITQTDDFQEKSEAALALSYVNHPIAVPFLQKVLASNKMVEFIAIDGLERIGNKEAVLVLINIINEKPESELALLSRSALKRIERQSSDLIIKQKINQFLYPK